MIFYLCISNLIIYIILIYYIIFTGSKSLFALYTIEFLDKDQYLYFMLPNF